MIFFLKHNGEAVEAPSFLLRALDTADTDVAVVRDLQGGLDFRRATAEDGTTRWSGAPFLPGVTWTGDDASSR